MQKLWVKQWEVCFFLCRPHVKGFHLGIHRIPLDLSKFHRKSSKFHWAYWNLIVSIGSVILKEEFIDIPSIGILNVHMGILPEYRGIGVTEWPIIEAESLQQIKLGITLHFIEKGVDTGPIILKKPISLKQDDSASDLDMRYLPEMVKLMVSGITLVRDEDLNSIKQERTIGIYSST